MSLSGKKPATYDDLFQLPENTVGEIINGELYAHPRPARRHARASSILGGSLTFPFDRGRGGPGGWVILFEPEIHLGGQILVPDFAGWRRERAPANDASAFYDTAPDWVCEVLSPSTARVDRILKLPIYFQENVRHVWLIDPTARTLEVLKRETGGWLLAQTFSEQQVIRAEPFDAVELELGSLWE